MAWLIQRNRTFMHGQMKFELHMKKFLNLNKTMKKYTSNKVTHVRLPFNVSTLILYLDLLMNLVCVFITKHKVCHCHLMRNGLSVAYPISRSQSITIRLYKMIIRPAVTYGAETWMLTSKTEKILMTWERKIMRKIYGPTKENGQWRIKTNEELRTKYKSQDTVTIIKI